jgi:hypothetical protein
MVTTWHPLSIKVGTNFSDKRRSLGQHSSLADSGHLVQFLFFSFFISYHIQVKKQSIIGTPRHVFEIWNFILL